MGTCQVDDLAMLMAFKMCFKMEREVFNAWLAAREIRPEQPEQAGTDEPMP